MPYIKEYERQQLKDGEIDCQSAGHLNYVFSCIIGQYIRDKQLSYQTINDIIGALEGAKLEAYRRLAVPYENEKLSTNGDVY